MKTLEKEFGGLHIAVNNAGIGGPLSPTGEYPIDGWDKVISINLSGVFYGLRYQIPAMLKSGGGSIMNIASILGKVGTRRSRNGRISQRHHIIRRQQPENKIVRAWRAWFSTTNFR